MEFNALLTAVLTNGIGAACAAAVLYLSWYRETKTLPALVDSFTKTHEKALLVFTDISKEERAVCQKWHENNLAQHKENRDVNQQVMAELKEQRHLLYNLLNQLGLKKAVEERGVASISPIPDRHS